jgi:hypothetical protein
MALRGIWKPATVATWAIAAMAVTSEAQAAPAFLPPVQLAGAAGRTEPRVAVRADDRRYVITNDASSGDAVVYSSADGGHTFTRTASEPANQTKATIDTDIVSTRPFAGAPQGRLIASELDGGGINFRLSYSDDGGTTWTASQGAQLGDTDRQWLATGPIDPATGKPRVYLLFHNLLSGTATHNVFVQTSSDGGASFGAPVPLTVPASQAWQDLQCADSGGPSAIFVNQTSGHIYAAWGTRTAPALGGCGSSVFGPFEVNVVAATRVWVATASPEQATSPGGWTPSLAVDDSLANGGKGKIVGMQLSPGAVDSAGNVYITYPESIDSYPNYDGAAIKYVSAPADLSRWSAPVTVAPSGGAGNVLTHIAAGDPGKLDFAYFAGATRTGQSPAWTATAAQTLNGLDASPKISHVDVSGGIVTYTGTASRLMGACDQNATDPTQGAQNGFLCDRSTDVWGVALDNECRVTFAWPVADKTFNDADPQNAGTFVSTQTGGTNVCKTRP